MSLFFIILLLLVAFGLSCLVTKSTKILSLIAFITSFAELIAIAVIVAGVVKNGSYSQTAYFLVDSLGAILLIILGIVGFIASWYSVGYLKAEVKKEVIGFRRVKQY